MKRKCLLSLKLVFNFKLHFARDVSRTQLSISTVTQSDLDLSYLVASTL